jgi:hypothetical protein
VRVARRIVAGIVEAVSRIAVVCYRIYRRQRPHSGFADDEVTAVFEGDIDAIRA